MLSVYDTSVTAHSQLWCTCHSIPSGMIHLHGDHPNMLRHDEFKKISILFEI